MNGFACGVIGHSERDYVVVLERTRRKVLDGAIPKGIPTQQAWEGD